MELMLRVYCGTQIKECPAKTDSAYSVGSGAKDSITVDGAYAKRGAHRITVDNSGWQLGDRTLQYDQIAVLDQEKHLAVCVYRATGKPDAVVELSAGDRILIGRSEECSIVVPGRQISGKHLEIYQKGSAWEFRDQQSRNGTYHNGTLQISGRLTQGDVLQIGFCTITFSGSALYIRSVDGVQTNLWEKQAVRAVERVEDAYPYLFKQSPRLIEEQPDQCVELQSPPNIGGKPSISWLSVLLTPILTVGVMVAVCLLVTNVMTTLYFSVPMTLIGALMSVLRYRGEKKKYHRTEQLRFAKYGEYLREQVAHLEKLSYLQRSVLETAAPSAEQCVKMAVSTDRSLWDRRIRDADFLSVRIGSGVVPASFSIRAPKQLLSLDVDILAEQPSQIVERFETVDDCPICMDLGENLSCGIIGNRAKAVKEGKNLILHAAAHHSYEDLRIVVLCDSHETEEWSFCRWLPHCFDDTRTSRYIADNKQQAARLLARLETILSARAAEQDRGYGASVTPKPFWLFVCATPDLIVDHPVMKYLTANDPALGVGAIYLFDRMGELPKDCHYIIDFVGTSNQFYERKHASHKQKFQMDSLETAGYETFSRAMAPLRVEAGGSSGGLPVSVSFLQGYHASTPTALNPEERWANAAPERGMAVPIGVRANGDPFLFDIHEKQHGPHGLVAGMTGSGKSEMVQSWILSMAVHFPPEAVSFVLIDFKGTGLLLPFKRLPHLAGCISDLDTSIGRNLIALENELTRRKALLDRHQVSNISAYLRLVREGKASEPMSYLFIVIDEFAEFKNRFPDFMQAVNRVFAIGRTLGVHMILLTQKPANVVDDKMNANTRFRWCLKVANSADSRDMLRHNDAAKITNPGRAYVQVGEDEVYEEIQSYWSGAPYNPYRDLSLQRSEKVSVVDLYGNRVSYEEEKTTGYHAEKNEINAIVEYLDKYCENHSVNRAKQLWTSKLPSSLAMKDLLQPAFDGETWTATDDPFRPAVGLVDDPRSQRQYPLRLNFPEEGHVAVYGAPGTGKTTLLHTAVMSMALNYTPEQVHLYMMDFGGGSLNIFRELPHVGGVVLSDDDTRMEKLTVMLTEELERRKKLLSGLGLVNISSYGEATGQTLPYIVLILDNFAPVPELYPNLDGFFQSIVRDGSSCGIYFLVTANTQNTLSFRISQHMKAALCLRMPDKGDYAPIVGRTNGLEPENHPGRGLLKADPPLEFQIALPANHVSEIRRVSEIRNTIAQMKQQWDGKRAPAIPVMPEVVRSGDYPTDQILCGLYTQSVQPCEVDLMEKQYLLLSCADPCPGVGQAIMGQTVQKLSPQTVVAFGKSGTGGMTMLSAEQFDREIERLMPELQKRKEAAGGAKLPVEQWPFIVVCIEDLKTCIDAISDQTLRRLSSIVVLGSGLNVALVAAANAEELTRYYHAGDAFTMNLVKKAALLLAGGSAQGHMAVKTDLPYSAASAMVEPGEGYYVWNAHAEKIKLVQQ